MYGVHFAQIIDEYNLNTFYLRTYVPSVLRYLRSMYVMCLNVYMWYMYVVCHVCVYMYTCM